MRIRARIAFAALAVGSFTLAPASLAQTREAADAAEALAPAEPGADAAVQTWDSVIHVVREALVPASEAEAANAPPLPAPATSEAAEGGPFVEPEAAPEASESAMQVAEWVIASGDNGGLPFIIIDKMVADLFIFDPDGEMLGEAPVLLGITSGDESAPVPGDRELSAISIEERTTPAGRFLARYGLAVGGRRVLWVDYGTSVALHPVVTANRRERRLQRLQSPTPDDNRITFGCINVPTAFYNNLIRPNFREAGGVVYILPETRPLQEVFPHVRVEPISRAQSRAKPG